MTVMTNLSNAVTGYSVSVSYTPDGGESVPLITLGNPVSVSLPSTGSTLQQRFILDNKEPFTLSASINNGLLNMYVALDPGQSSKAIWTASGNSSSPIALSVLMTDQNFHLGSYYYVILQSAGSRVDM